MHPVLLAFSLAGRHVEFGAYRTMLTVGGVAAVLVAALVAGRLGLPRKRVLVALPAALIGALVGARLLHAATNFDLYTDQPARLFAFDATGFALYGGLIGGAALGIGTARALRVSLWRFSDVATVGAGTGIVFVRIGCFLQGCCYGRPTGLPWGVRFPPGSPAWTRQLFQGLSSGDAASSVSSLLLGAGTAEARPVHPTQLYELGAALIGVALVLALLRRGATPGTPFLVGAIWFTSFRLLDTRFRWPSTTVTAPGWFYPLVYGLLLAGLLFALTRRPTMRAAGVDSRWS